MSVFATAAKTNEFLNATTITFLLPIPYSNKYQLLKNYEIDRQQLQNAHYLSNITVPFLTIFLLDAVIIST